MFLFTIIDIPLNFLHIYKKKFQFDIIQIFILFYYMHAYNFIFKYI